MRVLAIGDIHGCSIALETLLAAISPQPQDTIVTLGDYVDRGPDSKGVLDRLIELSQNCHLVALRGNHEAMMLNARNNIGALVDWKLCGGDATLDSYIGLMAVPTAHWGFIENQCVGYWETDTHFFVHAGVYPDLPFFDQPEVVLYWERFDYPQPHESGKIMVCGHTSQQNGLPRNIGHAVCIDTWACGKGWLSCLDVGSGHIWQTNQAGQQRTLWLDDFLELGEG